MSKVILVTLSLVVGFVIGIKTYQTAFDPDDYWVHSVYLATETARLGCVKAGRSYSDCTLIATQIYNDLEAIRKQVK